MKYYSFKNKDCKTGLKKLTSKLLLSQKDTSKTVR